MSSDLVRRYVVVGSRRVSNYVWAMISFIGGLDFVLTGLSSYAHINLVPMVRAEALRFFPQGLIMVFYGSLGLLISFYLVLTILWGVGGGFNKFDKQSGHVRIFRWGFPGKHRIIDLNYALDDIEAIRLELSEGLSPKRRIYLCVKGEREIPLTRVGQPISLEEIEKLASELAQFLQKDLLN